MKLSIVLLLGYCVGRSESLGQWVKSPDRVDDMTLVVPEGPEAVTHRLCSLLVEADGELQEERKKNRELRAQIHRIATIMERKVSELKDMGDDDGEDY